MRDEYDDRGAAEVVEGLTMGSHPARAIKNEDNAIVGFGRSSKQRTPFVRVIFEFTNGPNKGRTINYDGWMSPNALPYTIKNLRTCGWRGDDIDQIAELPSEVELVLEVEENTSERGRTFRNARVKFINQLGGRARKIKDEDRVSRDELRQWAAELKASGDIHREPPIQVRGDDGRGHRDDREPSPAGDDFRPPPDDGDIPF